MTFDNFAVLHNNALSAEGWARFSLSDLCRFNALVCDGLDREIMNSIKKKEQKEDNAYKKSIKYTVKKDEVSSGRSFDVFSKINSSSEIFLGGNIPDKRWFGMEFSFNLLSPWFSKDDREFYFIDNPVRKDRLFGVPFMSASAWKGLLRWSCRMEKGLFEHLQNNGMTMDGWKDDPIIEHLFGKSDDDLSAGRLVLFPTWFKNIGFEVINPHDRKTKAGKNPILYEVVPAGTDGFLRMLYAPLPSDDKSLRKASLEMLAKATASLLCRYGFSAKRTAGWGSASITQWKGFSNELEDGGIAISFDDEKDKNGEATQAKVIEAILEKLEEFFCAGEGERS